MNFYAQLAIATIILSIGFSCFFYGIALISGGEPEFMVFFRNTLLIFGGFAIAWGGLYWFIKQLEASSGSLRDRL